MFNYIIYYKRKDNEKTKDFPVSANNCTEAMEKFSKFFPNCNNAYTVRAPV